MGIILPMTFLLVFAHDFGDYAEGFYAVATWTTVLSLLFTFLLNISKIFKLIADFEMTIEQSV